MINIYNTDCMTFMAALSDHTYDLAIVDPEYGIGESSKNHRSRNTPIQQKNGTILKAPDNTYQRKDWDKKPPPPEYFDLLKSKTRHQIIWGANYFESIVGQTFKPPRRPDFEKFLSDYPVGWILWDKCNGASDFNDCELAWTSFDRPSTIFRFMWAGMMQGKSITHGHIQQGNKKLNQKRIHPTEKPILLYKWLLTQYVYPGWSLLDTHGGSMSIAIACHDLNFDIDICEKDPDIFTQAKARFENHQLQHTLL